MAFDPFGQPFVALSCIHSLEIFDPLSHTTHRLDLNLESSTSSNGIACDTPSCPHFVYYDHLPCDWILQDLYFSFHLIRIYEAEFASHFKVLVLCLAPG